MKALREILFYLVFVIGPVSLAAESQASIVMCKNKKIVRTLRVMKVDNDNKCIAMYSKGGTDKVVGSGRALSTCTGVMDNIKSNLEKAAWKCKETTADIIQHYEVQ